MAKKRTARLNEQFRREITDIVRNHARDPRIGIVTITDVIIAPDLGSARVFVSAMGSDDEKAESIAGLKAAAPFIRSELGRRLTIRMIPELRFEIDRTLEHAHRIEALLGTVRKHDDDEDDAEGRGSDHAGGGDDGASEDAVHGDDGEDFEDAEDR